ncbi:MAG: RluA family pseudouridine synthase [Candidatus Margulisiibacteriota bacterium]
MENKLLFSVQEDCAGQRIDQFLTACGAIGFTRSQIKKLIEDGHVEVNSAKVKNSYKIKNNDQVSVLIPPVQKLTVSSEDIPLQIIYEDADVVVINKPLGMVVHPAPGNYSGTLVNALLAHCTDLSGIGGVMRPGIVHRLDKDTTGLMVIAKNDLAHQSLTKQFKDKKIFKQYLAIVHGAVEPEKGLIENKIGRHPVNRQKMTVIDWEDRKNHGKFAVTEYKVLGHYVSDEGEAYSLVELTLKTGRTHQIRVHMQHLGFPVVGDKVYGKKAANLSAKRQMLHAARLGFTHPRSGEYLKFKAEMPEDMQAVLSTLQKQ